MPPKKRAKLTWTGGKRSFERSPAASPPALPVRRAAAAAGSPARRQSLVEEDMEPVPDDVPAPRPGTEPLLHESAERIAIAVEYIRTWLVKELNIDQLAADLNAAPGDRGGPGCKLLRCPWMGCAAAAELTMPIVLLDRSPGGTQAAKEGWGIRPGTGLGSPLASVRVLAHRCVAPWDGPITLSWA